MDIARRSTDEELYRKLEQKPRMVDGRGGEGSGEKGKAPDMIECIKKQRGPTNHQLKSPVWPEEGSQEGGGHSTEEYGRRNVPKA